MEDASKIDFEKLEQEESSENKLIEQVDEQQIDENIVTDVEEVKPGSSESGFTYLKNPKVGASITLTLAKVEKKPGRKLKVKATGKDFETGLLNSRTGKRTEFNLITQNDESFSVGGWGLFYAILGKEAAVEKLAIEQGSYNGIVVKITHILNGKDASMDVADLMKLRDIKTLAEAEAYKTKVAKAVKEGKIYKVEIVPPEATKEAK